MKAIYVLTFLVVSHQFLFSEDEETKDNTRFTNWSFNLKSIELNFLNGVRIPGIDAFDYQNSNPIEAVEYYSNYARIVIDKIDLDIARAVFPLADRTNSAIVALDPYYHSVMIVIPLDRDDNYYMRIDVFQRPMHNGSGVWAGFLTFYYLQKDLMGVMAFPVEAKFTYNK